MSTLKYVLTLVALTISVMPNLATAATVDAEICVSMTVLSQSVPDVIQGGGSVCADISGTAIASNPGDTLFLMISMKTHLL